MHTSQLRGAGPAVTGAALMMLVTGCGEDQGSGSSNRGSGSLTEETTVENAYIVPAYVAGRCAIQLDAGAEMRFTITNNRSTASERLLGLSTGSAEIVEIPTPVEIPAASTVSFGEPNAAAGAGDASRPAVRLQRLDPQLRPAMSTEVTFDFERSGELTMRVPVEACPVQTP
ncbi:hypothetical protein ACWDUN_04325 [Mycobacterium sp. NPDC003323]